MSEQSPRRGRSIAGNDRIPDRRDLAQRARTEWRATFREAGTVDRHASPERLQSQTTGPISFEAATRKAFGGESVETSRNGFRDGLT
jgi:hypothetical protein